MHAYRLMLIGFGTVGQGFAQILRDHGAVLAEQFGVRFVIVAVSDLRFGNVFAYDGVEPAALLEAINSDGNLGRFDGPNWSVAELIHKSNADSIVELSYTNLQTGEPALSHIRAALANGKNVVTTNKGPIALHYPELQANAQSCGAEIGVEGTVMSGTPSLRFAREFLAPAGIYRIQGILNGTTNYILTHMEMGLSYQDALAAAQANGYAEADPTGDVEGYDAAGKIVILANLLLDIPLRLSDVDRCGITDLTPEDIVNAITNRERWKLLATLELRDGGLLASVKPVRLSLDHTLASVSGTTNALTLSTRLLGDVTISGPGAGGVETGYALICDLLAIHRKQFPN